MLTAAWARGARLPHDPVAIRRVIGVTDEEWARAWPLVAKYWRREGDFLINDTQVDIYGKSVGLSAIRAEAGRRGGLKRQANAKQNGNQTGKQKTKQKQARLQAKVNSPVSSLQSLSQDQDQDPKDTLALRAREGDDGFERFWQVYPKKKSKADAVKAWGKLKPSPDLVTTMLGALAAQCRSHDWLREGGQFIPYPATWLNACRWEDELEEQQPAVSRRTLALAQSGAAFLKGGDS